jgi:hypothetical protein
VVLDTKIRKWIWRLCDKQVSAGRRLPVNDDIVKDVKLVEARKK